MEDSKFDWLYPYLKDDPNSILFVTANLATHIMLATDPIFALDLSA